LAALKSLAKRRYADRAIPGQVSACCQKCGFCTSRAVDIQLLVHRLGTDMCRKSPSSKRRLDFLVSVIQCGSATSICAVDVFLPDPRFFKPENPRSLVYTHKGYTRIVVVVNARHFLWISLFYLKKSSTWTLYKAVNDSVLPCCQFWTNFGAVVKADFVHNRYLWICRALSTGLLFCGVKPLLTQLAPVFRPTRLHWIFKNALATWWRCRGCPSDFFVRTA
jgi:hypothetical protein